MILTKTRTCRLSISGPGFIGGNPRAMHVPGWSWSCACGAQETGFDSAAVAELAATVHHNSPTSTRAKRAPAPKPTGFSKWAREWGWVTAGSVALLLAFAGLVWLMIWSMDGADKNEEAWRHDPTNPINICTARGGVPIVSAWDGRLKTCQKAP